jgi:hypothetical protein
MTFINALKKDLRAKLPRSIRVTTFHGFCYGLVRDSGNRAELYWSLLDLVNDDLGRLRERGPGARGLELAFHDLDDSDGLITDALARMNDYNAVTFVDVVYRALTGFEQHPENIPRFPLVVVDEYQDFSLLETRFIAELERQSPLLVAGDDDQSLYSFKRATPRHLRELMNQEGVASFNLPFCSRCTDVVVRAINDVVQAAVERGRLVGRVDKPFECFLPDKQLDSDAHPRIIHARLASHDKNANQMGNYVIDAISRIPIQDILESRRADDEYPTALVLGPRPFIEHAVEALTARFPQTQNRLAERRKIDPLDGYRYLATDADSKLGWRILLRGFYEMPADDAFTTALKGGLDFRLTIPTNYRAQHSRYANFIRRMLAGDALSPGEEADLARQLGRSIQSIREKIAPAMPVEPTEEEDEEVEIVAAHRGAQPEEPTIICTSLIGAKGLSAGYVFFVGCLDDYASTPSGVTDDDVCRFIVALSRTRKELHLISCGVYQRLPATPCSLIGWIDAARIAERRVE